MDLELYIAFIGASILLGLIPGPNVTLIVANSITYGARYGLCSVAGALSAMIPQLAVTVLGMSFVLAFMSEWFEVLRMFGVAYLIYLGLSHWFSKDEEDVTTAPSKRRSLKKVYWRGFWVSAMNPKTLLFFGAFLPQFVSPSGDAMLQMIVLSLTFLAVVAVVDSGWAILASTLRPILSKATRLRNKLSGGLLILAGAGLALAKKG